jgi:hypothetical protein
MILPILMTSLLVGVVAGVLLGRFAVPAGVLVLLAGTLPMGALYIYERWSHTTGDTSSLGLGATFLILTLAPAGLATLLTALLRN